MPGWAVVLVVIAGVAILGYLVYRVIETRRLRDHFGDEYERTIEDAGGRHGGESELRDRRRRRKSMDIVPVSDASRTRYSEQWQVVQARFVDRPADALREADVLVTEVMRERGYPMDDFERQAADVSVDHPEVVHFYRSAHATKEQIEKGGTSTERMREGLLSYRALFDRLLGKAETDEGARRAG